MSSMVALCPVGNELSGTTTELFAMLRFMGLVILIPLDVLGGVGIPNAPSENSQALPQCHHEG